MHACLFLYECMFVSVCMYVCACMNVCLCLYACMFVLVCMYDCFCMHVWLYRCMCIRLTYIVEMYIRERILVILTRLVHGVATVCMHVCLYVCIYVYISSICMCDTWKVDSRNPHTIGTRNGHCRYMYVCMYVYMYIYKLYMHVR
jgi:hypothetical protein